MNATEAARICNAISSLKPAQKFDEETPAFWALALVDVGYEDAKVAVVELCRRLPFIDISDLAAEVKRMRRTRLEGIDDVLVDVDPDDVQAWLDARRKVIADAAAGRLQRIPEPLAIEAARPEQVEAMVKAVADAKRVPDRDGEAEVTRRERPSPTLPDDQAEVMRAELAEQQAALTQWAAEHEDAS